jgi:hypothetical protein
MNVYSYCRFLNDVSDPQKMWANAGAMAECVIAFGLILTLVLGSFVDMASVAATETRTNRR